MAARKLNPADVRAWHKDGLTDCEMARRAGVAQSTVSKARARMGLYAHLPRTTWTHERVARLQALADAGLTGPQIAKKLGVAERAMRAAAARNGISIGAARREKREFENARIAEMYRMGCTVPGIAREMGMTAPAVYGRVYYMQIAGKLPVRAELEDAPAVAADAAAEVTPEAGPELTDGHVLPRLRMATRGGVPPVVRALPEAGPSRMDLREDRLARLQARHPEGMVQALCGVGRKNAYARLSQVAREYRVPLQTVQTVWHQVRP